MRVRERSGTLMPLVLAVAAAMMLAHVSYAHVPVVVNGSKVVVPRGTRVRDVIQRYASAPPGDLLAVSDGRIIERGAGRPAEVLVNGGSIAPTEVLDRGDVVVTLPGADVVEPVVVETRTVEVAPRVIGDGVVAKIVRPSESGLATLALGAVSHDIVSSETVSPPRPGVVRLAPLPGARTVALTFDDGPWPGHTEAILRVLDEKGVPATFFMIGAHVKRAPGIARAVADAGHAIGNHTYWHPLLDRVPDARLVREVSAGSHAIREATGVTPYWFRAPSGRLDPRVMTTVSAQGMRSALWTVDPQDWRRGATPRQVLASVTSAVRPGAIICLHDGGGDRSATVRALPAIIDTLRAEGYQFVTLDEMETVKSAW